MLVFNLKVLQLFFVFPFRSYPEYFLLLSETYFIYFLLKAIILVLNSLNLQNFLFPIELFIAILFYHSICLLLSGTGGQSFLINCCSLILNFKASLLFHTFIFILYLCFAQKNCLAPLNILNEILIITLTIIN